MCKSKIHRATITKVDLHYEGSIGIDKTLLKKADICPGEIVQVVNINNGARFETYAVEEKATAGCANDACYKLNRRVDIAYEND